MRVSLGIDTSCYTTSAAFVDESGKVVAASRILLPVEIGQRGLRQSEAVFAHVRQIAQVVEALQKQLVEPAEIVCVCASAYPRNKEDSYMPVFEVGLCHAQVIASLLRVPLYRVSHQQGHIAAGWIGADSVPEHFVALHLSGGTTELLDCHGGQISQIGGSLDLHAGQLVDRTGVALGLKFPAGPALEKLATAFTGQVEALLPVSMEQNDLYCHMSGAETRVQQWIQTQAYAPEKIAAEVFDFLSRTVSRMLMAGCKRANAQTTLVVGGVASSERLRCEIHKRLSKQRNPVKVVYGRKEFSADNAAGVASLGMQYWKKEQA